MFRNRLPIVCAGLLLFVSFAGCLGADDAVNTGPVVTTDFAEGASIDKFGFEATSIVLSGTFEKVQGKEKDREGPVCELFQTCAGDQYRQFKFNVEGLPIIGTEDAAGEIAFEVEMGRDCSGDDCAGPVTWVGVSETSKITNGTWEGESRPDKAASAAEFTHMRLQLRSEEDDADYTLLHVSDLVENTPATVSNIKPFSGVTGTGKLEPLDGGQVNLSVAILGLPAIGTYQYVAFLKTEGSKTSEALGVLTEDPSTGASVLRLQLAEEKLAGWSVFVSIETPGEAFPEPSGFTVLSSKFAA